MRIGASTEFFYQRNTGGAGFCILITLSFREPVDVDEMRRAATRAARLYPELCFRPALKEGRVVPLPNENEVCIFEDGERGRCYGTEETAGYLFYFTYTDRVLCLHLFHGMTDVRGVMAYIRTMLYYYYRPEGVSEEDPFFKTCRTDPEELSALDEEDMVDPYRKYADMSSEPPVMITGPAFQIPEDMRDPSLYRSRQYRITLRTSEYLKKTKEYGASFAAFLHLIICDAVDSAYHMGDETFIGMLPADMRSYFGSKTLVNCSDSIMLAQTAEDRKADVSTRCQRIKENLREHLNTDYFSALMADKVRSVDGYQPPEPATEQQDEPARLVTPFTIGVSAPGKQEIGGGMDEHLDSVVVTGTSRVPIISQANFGEVMTICVMMKNDSSPLPGAIRDTIASHGLSCELTDDGWVYTDMVCTEKLERIG